MSQSEPPLRPHASLRHPDVLIACWFGSGFSPKAPGTAGSLAALPVLVPLQLWGGEPALWTFALFAALAGLWASERYMERTGRHDPGEVVIDEVAGMAIALAAVPPNLAGWLAGFALFRLFDIWKPWPVRWADRRLPGAWGVMLDDVLAGVYAYGVVILGGFFYRLSGSFAY